MKFHLRFDVSVENAVSVHVVDCFQNLVHVVFDSLFGQVVSAALDGLIHVHIHEFKN
jgi:hypothetical protein